jgi:hypothetical protein
LISHLVTFASTVTSVGTRTTAIATITIATTITVDFVAMFDLASYCCLILKNLAGPTVNQRIEDLPSVNFIAPKVKHLAIQVELQHSFVSH